jgi:hypothetical protein
MTNVHTIHMPITKYFRSIYPNHQGTQIGANNTAHPLLSLSGFLNKNNEHNDSSQINTEVN